jgi:hypothetical protein
MKHKISIGQYVKVPKDRGGDGRMAKVIGLTTGLSPYATIEFANGQKDRFYAVLLLVDAECVHKTISEKRAAAMNIGTPKTKPGRR